MRCISFVAAAFALSVSIGSAGPAPQAVAPTQQPQKAGESFRVDPATAALTPLEAVKSRTEGASRGKVRCYIQGARSPVTIRRSEPLVFAASLEGSVRELDSYRQFNILYKLEFLFVSDEARRYATGKLVPMDGQEYGERVSNNPKRPKDLTQSYTVKPREPLAPGEYAVTIGGMMRGDCDKNNVFAFSIVD